MMAMNRTCLVKGGLAHFRFGRDAGRLLVEVTHCVDEGASFTDLHHGWFCSCWRHRYISPDIHYPNANIENKVQLYYI